MAKIKDLPRVDRPRERLEKKGAQALHKEELLAIILRTGIKGKNVLQLAQDILSRYGDKKLIGVSYKELRNMYGVGPSKAAQIISAIELGKRLYKEKIEKEISDHIIMQWKLAKLGKKAGSKVWVPRSDQGKLVKNYDFSGYEEEFTVGIDMPARYVDQIDVVWKKEFQIDAAFEIENTTSIYSGLLRFADLGLVAPNSNFPLFIVAPIEKKEKVFNQIKRPIFQKIDFGKKVRYLSYEAINEIDEFFSHSTSGLNANVLMGKSEEMG